METPRSPFHPQNTGAETWWRVLFGIILLVLVPVGIIMLTMAVKYQGLQSPVAWEYAQVARNLATGHGFVTSAARPLMLAIQPTLRNQPDLWSAPGQPVLLALAFNWFTPSDRVAAFVGLMVWLISVWLTFVVARRWFGGRAAALAVIFYASNPAVIMLAVAGLPYPLATVFLLLACGLTIPRWSVKVGTPTLPVAGWQLFLAGLCCALAMLTHWALGVVVLALGWYVAATALHSRARAVLWLGEGFLLLAFPWLLRNWIASQGVTWGLAGYSLLANTHSFPGESIWRTLTPPPAVSFLLKHPREFLTKLPPGAYQFIRSAPVTLHLIVGIFFIAALPAAMRNLHRRGLAMLLLTGLGLSAGVSCLLQPDSQLLVVWTPLIAMLAAARLTDWITQRVGPLSLRWLKFKPEPPPPRAKDLGYRNSLERVLESRLPGKALAYLLVTGAACLPLTAFFLFARSEPNPNRQNLFAPLKSRVPANTVIVTDQPAMVAWYADRPAVWLPQQESSLDRIETLAGTSLVYYVTSAGAPDSRPDAAAWWLWVASPQGVFRGLFPTGGLPGGAVLRARPPEPTPARSSADLDRALTEAGKNTESSDAHYRLAAEFYRLDRLREADAEFQTATQLDPQNTQALLGSWQTLSRINDTTGILALADHVAEMEPRLPGAGPALEEAARFFERTAARSHDPWLLLNGALCQAKLKHWDRAEACCRRVAALAPKELPLRLLLGDLYLQKGFPEQALTEFQQLVDEQPLNAVAREALGLALREAGQLPAALEAFEKAARLRADWPVPQYMAGTTCLQLKLYDAAAAHFETAVQLAPHTTRYQFALGTAATLLNDQPRAAKVYETIIAEYPNDPVALNNLAVAYAKSGQKLDQAVALIRRAVAAFPHNPEIQDSFGLICTVAGLPQEAIPVLQQVIRNTPQNGLAHYHLAKALLATGQQSAATGEFHAALALELPALEKADAEALLAKP